MKNEFNNCPRICRFSVVALVFSMLAGVTAVTAREPNAILVEPSRPGAPSIPRISRDLTGVLTTRENLLLKLSTDLGSVRIQALEKGAAPVVRYTVHIETDARGTLASQLLEHYVLNAANSGAGVEITGNLPQQAARGSNAAQFWVHFEIFVPATYGLDITTGAGDIQTSDIGGTASLVTEGGNIVAGRLATNYARAGGKLSAPPVSVKLQTEGGHIRVEDVSGDLKAFTAGGHINTGNILGAADLHSGGGHIRAAGIGGKAELVTEGGNITVGKAGSFVAVKTGGGQIDFGEVRGSVQAQTRGGGIRVLYVSGPMDVESNGGSICLTRVSGAVKAATGSGTITAWINPEASKGTHSAVSLSGASQLSSGAGDIIVFLPRNLAANIEAVVENGGAHRIEADPALALQITKSGQSNGPLTASAVLNGGGPLLRLKTTGGKIKLQYLESETALWDSMMRDQKARMERDLAMTPVVEHASPWPDPYPQTQVEAQPNPQPEYHDHHVGTWVEKLEIRVLGGIREDGDEFQKRINSAPRPAYPEVARKAGIEGMVRLQVRLTENGRVEVQKILEGDTVLADAAIAAVKQWRGKPVWMDGKPVDVISTVSFDFHLRNQ
jgi:TonB family protein